MKLIYVVCVLFSFWVTVRITRVSTDDENDDDACKILWNEVEKEEMLIALMDMSKETYTAHTFISFK